MPAFQHARTTLAVKGDTGPAPPVCRQRSDGFLVELHAAQRGLGHVADEKDGGQSRRGTEREHRRRHAQAPAGAEWRRVAGRLGRVWAGLGGSGCIVFNLYCAWTCVLLREFACLLCVCAFLCGVKYRTIVGLV